MTFDTEVPNSLKEIQIWFGEIVSQPIDENYHINPIAPNGKPIENEAWRHILPSHTLQPKSRLEIYNQQYWWRFFKCLQENFPLLVRLFGYADFNQSIATPFLTKYPASHWSLNFLGHFLPQWIEEEYIAKDKKLVLDAAKIDLSYVECFVIEKKPVITNEISNISEKKLYLQPSTQLFKLPYDLFAFREEFLQKDPDYWVENDFPKLKHQETYTVLYRNDHHQMATENINFFEYQLLEKFKDGISLDEICSYLETIPQNDPLIKEVETHLHLWFQRWVGLQWLSI